jgi:hypothetical protein
MKFVIKILFFVILATVLSGFRLGFRYPEFPAPISDPALMLYHNFTTAELDTEEQKWKSPIEYDGFEPFELFFYISSPDNYCIILTGNFNLNLLLPLPKEAAVKDSGLEYSKLFTRFLEMNSKRFGNMTLALGPDMIMISPAIVFADLADCLIKKKNVLDKKFDAFKKMYVGRPGLACEIDFEKLNEATASSGIKLPTELSYLQHFRLIVDDRLLKAQLFLPDDQARQKLNELINGMLPALNEYSQSNADFTSSIRGSSIFIEAEADKKKETLMGRKLSGWIASYFKSKIEMDKVAVLSNEENAKE